MSVFDERMRWVTRIATPILLTDVGDHRFGVFRLDLKSSDERIFGVHGDVVRFPLQFKSDGKLHQRASFTNILSQTFADVQSMRCVASVLACRNGRKDCEITRYLIGVRRPPFMLTSSRRMGLYL
jgi:hypothetical protein